MSDSHDLPESGFDPAEHTAKEVIEHVEKNPDEAEVVAALEAEGKDRTTVAAAVEEVVATKPKGRKRQAHTGTYVLEQGDTPSTVARQLLGRGSRGREIVAANEGVKWRPGVEITIPTD